MDMKLFRKSQFSAKLSSPADNICYKTVAFYFAGEIKGVRTLCFGSDPFVCRTSDPSGNDVKDFLSGNERVSYLQSRFGTAQSSPPFQRWETDRYNQQSPIRDDTSCDVKRVNESSGSTNARIKEVSSLTGLGVSTGFRTPPLKRWATLCRPETGLKQTEVAFPPRRSCTHNVRRDSIGTLVSGPNTLWGKSACARKVRKEGAQRRDRVIVRER
jgi:hypothetical protein